MNLDYLLRNIQAKKTQLLNHTIYHQINSLERLQKFTQHHVFAVWDFMSLLKSLQIELTSVSIPWRPIGNPNSRYLINEIVLGEESDQDENGEVHSHYELYLEAMEHLGANTAGIQELVNNFEKSGSIMEAINQAVIPQKIKNFLNFTFEVCLNQPVHIKAAVFTFGREDLIPDMFLNILEDLYNENPNQVKKFKYYIERHIEVDGGHHSHLALELVKELCGDDPQKWEECTKYVIQALETRIGLWDSILE